MKSNLPYRTLAVMAAGLTLLLAHEIYRLDFNVAPQPEACQVRLVEALKEAGLPLQGASAPPEILQTIQTSGRMAHLVRLPVPDTQRLKLGADEAAQARPAAENPRQPLALMIFQKGFNQLWRPTRLIQVEGEAVYASWIRSAGRKTLLLYGYHPGQGQRRLSLYAPTRPESDPPAIELTLEDPGFVAVVPPTKGQPILDEAQANPVPLMRIEATATAAQQHTSADASLGGADGINDFVEGTLRPFAEQADRGIKRVIRYPDRVSLWALVTLLVGGYVSSYAWGLHRNHERQKKIRPESRVLSHLIQTQPMPPHKPVGE